MKAPREPDAIDAARVLAAALLLSAGAAVAHEAGIPPAVRTALQHLGFLAVPLAYCRLAGLPILPSNGFTSMTLRQVALVLLAALGSLWLLKGLVDAQSALFQALGLAPRVEREVEQINRMIDRAKEEGGLGGLTLLVLIPALCEETLFRGVVFRGFRRQFGFWAALGVTSALFGALHQSLAQIGLMFFLGAYLGTLVHLTGSLWAGVLAHGVNNLAVLVSREMFGRSFDLESAPPGMVALSAAVLAMALALLALERARASGKM